jgi:hypothetical protein
MELPSSTHTCVENSPLSSSIFPARNLQWGIVHCQSWGVGCPPCTLHHPREFFRHKKARSKGQRQNIISHGQECLVDDVLPCLSTIESNLECHDSKHQVFIQSKSFPLGIFRCSTPNRWKQVDKCVRFREQLCASALQSGWWFHFVHSFMIPAFHISVGYAWIWHNHHSPSYIHVVSHILIILHVRRITHIYPKGN